MNCLSHSLRLPLESVSQLHDVLVALGAVLFISVMAFSAHQSSRNKGARPFFWGMIMAVVGEAIGCAAFAIHSQNPSSHGAFAISFVCSIIAPCVLVTSCYSLFERYMTPMLSSNPLLQHGFTKLSALFGLLQMIVLAGFGISEYHVICYLSPRPIEGVSGALERLSHHESAIKILAASHIFQLLCLGLFTVSTAFWTARSSEYAPFSSVQDFKARRHVFSAVSIVNILFMFRSACKIADYISDDVTAIKLVQSRGDFWLYDALPVLVSMIVLCSAFSKIDVSRKASTPFAYTQVPEIKIVCVDEELPVSYTKA